MEILRRLGIKSPRDKAQDETYTRLVKEGYVDLLIAQARALRESGDQTAIVAELRHTSMTPLVMVALRWGLKRDGSLLPQSLGIAFAAVYSSTPTTRFTDGRDWNYLGSAFVDKYPLHSLLTRLELSPEEISVFRYNKVGNLSLQDQIQLAMKVAVPQSDYRYRKGGSGRLGSYSFRVVF